MGDMCEQHLSPEERDGLQKRFMYTSTAASTVKASYTHQYTIPVEWVYVYSTPYRDAPSRLTKKTVTKLMCQCGAEVERNTNGA